mgnify:FL=1
MVNSHFVSSFTSEGGARIQLQQHIPAKGLFGKARIEVLETSKWPEADQAGTAIRLLDIAARGEASDSGDAIELTASSVASLNEPDALAVGLPPAAPLVLSLRGRGLIVQDDFGVDLRWTRLDGSGVAVQEQGARIRINGRDFRLPEPLYTLHRAAKSVNEAVGLAGRQAAFAELRAMLDKHDEQALVDGLLRETRVAFAGNFSLSLNGSDFDPVLFAPKIAEAAESGGEIDENLDNLLTPEQQAAFAKLFRNRQGKARSYLMPDGILLFMDPALADALSVVGEKQRAPEPERREFAASPRRVIAESLGRPSENLEALFLETTQYSERVVGIDPWRKPVLPWIKPKPNSWLPESFGIAVGDPPVRIEIPPEELQAALAQVQAAIVQGVPTIVLSGVEVPASPATVAAIQDLIPLTEPSKGGDLPPNPPPAISEKLFLQVRDNLEEVLYAPLTSAEAISYPPASLPQGVRTTLKPHQVEGFQWLAAAWRSHRPGVLLADDMGLGKTLQALTFFCWLREQGVKSPILIVAPTGLLANWQAEIDRHLSRECLGPILRAYGGTLRAHREGKGTDLEIGSARLNTSDWNDAGVVLTTYETMRDYHFSMARVDFAVIAYDEAQKLKNPAAQVSRAAKTLRSRLSMALTGTPVENRLQDLWSLTDVVQPSFLGSSKGFEARYGSADLEGLRELNSRLTTEAAPWPPFMIRRMKADHVEGLPHKKELEKALPMPPAQATAYSQAVQRALGLRGTGAREAILETLGRLRSISLAPTLPKVGDEFACDSARLQATFAILDDIKARGEKALIFCESLELQPLLAAEIRRRYCLSRTVPCISGSVAGDHRQKLVDDFQARPPGFDVMILSPKAGGVGLTITAANHVIHLTRWWNPAVEDQATDRAYRIGQTKDVSVWVPIAEHPDPSLKNASFDHRLAALLKRKRTLAHGLLAEPESPGDVAALFEDVLSSQGQAQELSAPQASDPIASASGEHVSPSSDSKVNPQNIRWKKAAGQEVPWQVFCEPLLDKHIKRLEIIDPYAAASARQCQALSKFLSGLKERQIQLDSVTLECWDAASIDGGDGDLANQRRVLASAISEAGLNDVRFDPRFISRRSGQWLHDRSITAHLAGGESVVWDLSGGIDLLMLNKSESVISRWINPSAGI